jgi:4-amino-4-deoxy-L-arabinose transferase-like glycosyltransferase/DNA-binding beta-propeller fold protein YncE
MIKRLSTLSFFFGLAALIVGGTGQFLLEANHIQAAIILFILAVGLGMLAFRKSTGANVVLSAGEPAQNQLWPVRAYIFGGSAILFSALGFYLFTTSVLSIYPWILHLASVGLFVLCIVWVDRSRTQRECDQRLPWKWPEIGIFVAILGIAVFLRLYRLDQIPFGTWYDEASGGLFALNLINHPGYLPIFSDTAQLPAHLYYLVALSFRIFGESTYALRLVSVCFGLATVVAAYFAGKELFDRRMGLVVAFLLAVSRWDINWSRIAMHGVTVPFFELLTMGFILRALRRQRLLDYTLAGMTLGFGLCFYFSFRLFPVVICFFLGALWLTRHDLVRSSWRGFLILILGAVIAAMPVIQFAVTQPEAFWGRLQTTSILQGKTIQEAIKSVAQTTREHLLMFNYQGDRNGRHNLSGAPMLDPIAGSLLVLGTALSLARLRRPASLLLLVWLLFMLAPGIFSLDFESPQSYRSIGSLPAVYLLAAVPIQALWQEWDKRKADKPGSEAKWYKFREAFFAIPLVMGLAVIGYYNYHIYFDLQPKSFDSWSVFSTPETIVGNVMRQMGNKVNYYVSSFYYQTPTVSFLAPAVTSYLPIQPHETLPVVLDDQKGVVFFVDADRKPFYLQAQQYYPHASFQEFKGPQGQIMLYEIYLKPADIAASEGLVASYFQNANWSGKPFMVRNEANFNFEWVNGNPLGFPFYVEWKGVLFAPEYGAYQLGVRTPSPVAIFIDEAQVVLPAPGEQIAKIELAKGNHTIRILAVARDGHFTLLWKPPSGVLSPIPLSSLLLPPITNNGLVGSYFANGSWQNPPAYVEIDPWIHYYFHNPPLQRPYTVEWIGKIKIANAGQYHFGLESIDESSLYIDNQQVINDLSPNQYVEQVVDLPAGFHLFRLRFGDRTGSTHINIYWSPPGSEQTIIPSDVLFPLQAGEKVINTVTLVKESPPQPNVANSNALNPTDLPAISAQLLWETGSCGSGQGQFQSPHGITIDQKGNIWVADSGNKRIVGITPQGKAFTIFGQAGDGQGQFLQPYDLIVEPDGNLVVLDSGSQNFLQRFSQTGKFLASFGTTLGVYSPRGLGIDRSGNIYIADTGNARLAKISPAGDLLTEWKSGAGKLGFNQLVSVAIAADGSVYVVNSDGEIWKLSPDGKYTNWPAIAAIDTATGSHTGISSNNIIYVTDPEKQMVLSFTANGQPAGQLRATNQNPGLFSKPVGLAIGPGNTLYISDSISCQISAFKLLTP